MPKEGGLVYKGSESREKQAKRLAEAVISKVDESGIYESKLKIHEPALTEALEDLDPKELTLAENSLKAIKDKTEDGGDLKESERVQDIMWGIRQLGFLRSLSAPSNRKMTLEKMAKKDFYRLMSMENTSGYGLDDKIKNALYQMATVSQNMAMARFPKEWKKQEAEHDEEVRDEMRRKRDELGKMNVS